MQEDVQERVQLLINDQAIRWSSTYLMVKRLIELKPFLIDMANPCVSLTEDKWNSIEKLEVLTSGMFLKEWRNLEFRMSQTGCLIAEGITNSTKRREALLLGNKVVLASIYIDPMHRILLNDDQLSNVRNTLLEIAYTGLVINR